ncbi:MAG: hypothetical protein ACI35W_05510 [Anaeroplasmataceae bacterium]
MTKKEFNSKLNQVKKSYRDLINSLELLDTDYSFRIESKIRLLISYLEEFKLTIKNYNKGMKSNRILHIYFTENCDSSGNFYHLIVDEANKEFDIDSGSQSNCIGIEHKNAFKNYRELRSYAVSLFDNGYKRVSFYDYSRGLVK